MSSQLLSERIAEYKTVMGEVVVRSQIAQRDAALAVKPIYKKDPRWPAPESADELFNVATVNGKLNVWSVNEDEVRLYDAATLDSLGKAEKGELHGNDRLLAESDWFLLFERGRFVHKSRPSESVLLSRGRPVQYAGSIPFLTEAILIFDTGVKKFKLVKWEEDRTLITDVPRPFYDLEKVLCAGGGYVFYKRRGGSDRVYRLKCENVYDRFVAFEDGEAYFSGRDYTFLLSAPKIYYLAGGDAYAVQSPRDNSIEVFFGGKPDEKLTTIPFDRPVNDIKRMNKGTFAILPKSEKKITELVY